MPRPIDHSNIPPHVLAAPPRTLHVVSTDSQAVFYIREDDFRMRVLPPIVPFEIRLGTWETDGVKVVVLLARLARSDALTFEQWLNIGEPIGVRTLQCLAAQSNVDYYVVGDNDLRYSHGRNTISPIANSIVNEIRSHAAWSRPDFDAACRRVNKLYPTASALWWEIQAPVRAS